jgi:hypothetical protein
MAAVLAFIIANKGLIIGIVYGLLSLFVAVRPKSEGVVGRLLQILSALQPENSKGSAKIPGFPAGPVVSPIMKGTK